MSQNEKIFQQFQPPEGWHWVKLGEVCGLRNGFAFKSDNFVDFGVPLIRISDIQKDIVTSAKSARLPREMLDDYHDFTLKNGDILIAMSGATTGKAGIYKDENVALQNQRVGKFEPNSKLILNEFLWFAVKMISEQILRKAYGSAQPNISGSEIKSFIIPLPPLPEQHRIVARIQELMQDIERARAASGKQLESAKALPAAYLREVFESDEAKKWERKKLGEVCKINLSRPKNFTRSPDVPTTFIPMAAVDERTGTAIKPEVVPYLKVSKGYTYFEENDVLFAKITPCMQNGKHMIAKNLIDGIGFGTTEFHVLRPGKEILPEWIWYFVRRACFLHEATTYFSGAVGQQRVPENFLANSIIPCPPLSVQKNLVAELDEKTAGLEKIYMAAKKQLDIINVFPQKILNRAFKGEL